MKREHLEVLLELAFPGATQSGEPAAETMVRLAREFRVPATESVYAERRDTLALRIFGKVKRRRRNEGALLSSSQDKELSYRLADALHDARKAACVSRYEQ